MPRLAGGAAGPRRARAGRTIVAAAIALAALTAGAADAGAAGKALDGVVNLNTAGADVLELLPGVGPAKVRNILWYRQRHPFRTVDELVRIKGIGRKMVRKLRPHLAVAGPTTAQAVRAGRGNTDPPSPEARPPPPARSPPPATRLPPSVGRPVPPSGGRPVPGRPVPGRPASARTTSPRTAPAPWSSVQGVRSHANLCLRPR